MLSGAEPEPEPSRTLSFLQGGRGQEGTARSRLEDKTAFMWDCTHRELLEAEIWRNYSLLIWRKFNPEHSITRVSWGEQNGLK